MVAAIVLQVVADFGVRRDADVLVQNGAPHFGAAADIAIVQDDRIFHQRAGVDSHVSKQNRVPNRATGEDTGAGHDRIDSLTAAVLVVEREFGGRIRIAGSAQGPLTVI